MNLFGGSLTQKDIYWKWRRSEYEKTDIDDGAAVMAASCMAGGCGKKAASVERISGEERNHDADPAAQEPESGTDAEEVPESESDRQNETSGTILLEIPAEYDGEWRMENP